MLDTGQRWAIRVKLRGGGRQYLPQPDYYTAQIALAYLGLTRDDVASAKLVKIDNSLSVYTN